MKKSTKLASNCFSVKGHNKHLLIDLQNDEWYHVDFHFAENDDVDLSALNKEDKSYLLSRQILIQIPENIKNQFSRIDKNFSTPSIIESAIIDRDKNSSYRVDLFLLWIDKLIVKYCQVRYFDFPDISEIEEILNRIRTSHIESIEFLIPYSQKFVHFFENSISKNQKIHSVVFHSALENKSEFNLPDKKRLFITEKIKSSNSCGNIHPNYFSRAKKHILKSMNFNSCLYKKIGIDVIGNIKNCPSMANVIGHINSLDDINIDQLDTEYWYIKKDHIEICKECEFRYICNDCRVQVDKKNGRPKTCIYNPYTNLWKGQEGYNEPEIKA